VLFCRADEDLTLLQLFINGDSKQFSDNLSLADLILQLELPAVRIAVELNRVVIRRGEWSSTILREGDRVEIVHFVGGGTTAN